LITTLIFEKKAAMFSQKIGNNRRKIVIITSTPDSDLLTVLPIRFGDHGTKFTTPFSARKQKKNISFSKEKKARAPEKPEWQIADQLNSNPLLSFRNLMAVFNGFLRLQTSWRLRQAQNWRWRHHCVGANSRLRRREFTPRTSLKKLPSVADPTTAAITTTNLTLQ
jgi:hypothetical protein